MDLVYVDAVVKHGDKSMPVKLLVDSGAMYTVLRRDVWEYLGLRPIQEAEFILANGTVIKRWVSEAVIELGAMARDTRQSCSARVRMRTYWAP